MVDVVLVYPYFRPNRDKSPFRFPPLGLGYVASHLRRHGYSVGLVDCTFMTEEEAVTWVTEQSPSIIGIYSMFTIKTPALHLAATLRDTCDLLVAGGPLPTLFPEEYLQLFDVVCIGEGEQTMLDLADAHASGRELSEIPGLCIRVGGSSNPAAFRTPPRPLIQDLDSVAFPARDLFDNQSYQEYFERHFDRKETSIITTRGCPYDCDFCSQPIFQGAFRARSARNVVDELEAIVGFGYDWVWFTDDCFTLVRNRIFEICQEIRSRGLDLRWECLSRVDSFDAEMARQMRAAGCERVFFGIESGDDGILKQMKKRVGVHQARQAIEAAVEEGLKAGAFFILGYPGETDSTMLKTIRFATRLPVDYLSFSLPYPIPGTGLHKKVGARLRDVEFDRSSWRLVDHALLYDSEFSEPKLKLGIAKAAIQHRIWKHTGRLGYALLGAPFEALTDRIFKRLT